MRGYDSQLAFGVVNLGDTAERSVGRGSISDIGRSASSAGGGAGAGGEFLAKCHAEVHHRSVKAGEPPVPCLYCGRTYPWHVLEDVYWQVA